MRAHLFVPLTVIALAACDDPSGTGGGKEGSLRFDYTGSVAGTYRGEGTSTDTMGTVPFAFARTQPIGLEMVSRGVPDAPPVARVLMAADQRGAGTYTVARLCDIADGGGCVSGHVEFPPDAATGARQRYFLTAGTLTITSARGGRMRGTFAGTAQMHIGREIEIRNGVFDLPLLSR